jgi:hypothetical protein
MELMESHGRDLLDYFNLAFAFVGLAVLCIYTFYTRRQVKISDKALKESLAGSEAALAETRRSNDATEKSNEIAERSLELGRRAWLVIDIDQPVESITQLTIKNVGDTPATDLCIKYHLTHQLTHQPDTTDVPNHFQLSMAFIGPDSVSFLPLPVPIEKFQRLVRQEEVAFYCYCEVVYKDIFNKLRTTATCWQYAFIKTGEPNGEFRWAFAPKYASRME